MWFLFYLAFLLVLAVCVGITLKKIRKDTYNPYYLKHVVIGYGIAGAVFLSLSLLLFFQL